MNQRLIPEKYRILSGSWIKVIAVVSMLIDHIGYCLLAQNPIPLFTVFGKTVSVFYLFRLIGRMAFPLFAFLLVEGFVHTNSRIRYAIGLGVFALLSELPHDLMMRGTLFYWRSQNIFFTLLIGLLGVWLLERLSDKPWLRVLGLLGLYLAALFSRCEYGVQGYCFILLLYALRAYPVPRAIIGVGFLTTTWKIAPAYIPIALYNGKRGFIRGRALKYAFYLFYPAHLLVLYWIRLKTIGY